MPAGLQIFNDAATVQIDEAFSNLLLVKKGTATFTAQSGGGYTGTLTVVGNAPVLFFGVSTGTVGILQAVKSGGTWTYTVCSATGGAAPYYAFDAIPTPASTFGLQVFSATGSLVFDSNSGFMRIHSVVQTASGWPSTTVSLPGGRQYAAALGYSRSMFDYYGGPNGTEWAQGVLDGVQVTASQAIHGVIEGGVIPDDWSNYYNYRWTAPPQLMIIDVTYL